MRDGREPLLPPPLPSKSSTAMGWMCFPRVANRCLALIASTWEQRWSVAISTSSHDCSVPVAFLSDPVRTVIQVSDDCSFIYSFSYSFLCAIFFLAPVDDELVKVVMISRDDEDFTQQVLSGVRFAPLLHFPRMETIIPSTVWNPSIHNDYPDSFRASCKELLLCSNSEIVQPRHRVPQMNLAAMLPKVLWMEVMSFTHRSCKLKGFEHALYFELILEAM